MSLVARSLMPAIVGLLLVGCSLDEGSDGGRGEGGSDTRQVSAAGISFEVPEGWEELDAGELAEGAGENSQMAEVADSMGVTADQMEQVVRSMDLFLVSDEGANQGFLDNVNVLQVPGRMPNDSQVKLQFMGLGADVSRISHERSDLGDTTVVVYELELLDRKVQGEALFVDAGDGPVSITVSASDRDTTDEVSEGILDTLAKAS